MSIRKYLSGYEKLQKKKCCCVNHWENRPPSSPRAWITLGCQRWDCRTRGEGFHNQVCASRCREEGANRLSQRVAEKTEWCHLWCRWFARWYLHWSFTTRSDDGPE